MMLSLSDKSDADAAPASVFSFAADPSFPAPAPVSAPVSVPEPSPAPAPAPTPVVAKGALDVTAVLAESDAPAAPPVEEDGGGGGLSQQQLMKQLLGKKGKTASKSAASGARKLAVSFTEVKLESFEGEFTHPIAHYGTSVPLNNVLLPCYSGGAPQTAAAAGGCRSQAGALSACTGDHRSLLRLFLWALDGLGPAQHGAGGRSVHGRLVLLVDRFVQVPQQP